MASRLICDCWLSDLGKNIAVFPHIQIFCIYISSGLESKISLGIKSSGYVKAYHSVSISKDVSLFWSKWPTSDWRENHCSYTVTSIIPHFTEVGKIDDPGRFLGYKASTGLEHFVVSCCATYIRLPCKLEICGLIRNNNFIRLKCTTRICLINFLLLNSKLKYLNWWTQVWWYSVAYHWSTEKFEDLKGWAYSIFAWGWYSGSAGKKSLQRKLLPPCARIWKLAIWYCSRGRPG